MMVIFPAEFGFSSTRNCSCRLLKPEFFWVNLLETSGQLSCGQLSYSCVKVTSDFFHNQRPKQVSLKKHPCWCGQFSSGRSQLVPHLSSWRTARCPRASCPRSLSSRRASCPKWASPPLVLFPGLPSEGEKTCVRR